MNTKSSIKSLVALSLMPSFNNSLCLDFIKRCGGIDGIFTETDRAYDALCHEFGYNKRKLNRGEALAKVDEEMNIIEKEDIKICSIDDELYPPLLKQITDYPLVLYYKGDIELYNNCKTLAIVGTRNSSALCRKTIASIVEHLSACREEIVIVSGLAYGIDSCAHRVCIDTNTRTFAVFGTGVNKIYPSTHKDLAKRILETNGAWISEFPCSIGMTSSNFLRRNRIVAGICKATLIGESAIKGGSMTTARLALSYDRDVFAVPGRPSDKYSKGCNQLIKENIAALVENGEDVARLLGMNADANASQMTLDMFDEDPDTGIILEIIRGNGACNIDDIIRLSRLNNGKVQGLIMQLEMENKIVRIQGNQYCINEQ